MQFTPKLLLTTLICLTGAPLAYCSQVQARLTASSTAATTLDEQKRKQALELLRQANELLAGAKDSAEQKQAVAQAVMRATTQSATQTTEQEIVERDAKRVKISQEKDENPKNWLSQYAGKMDPEEQKKLETAKIQALNKSRSTILPHILYDLLDPMPRELTNLIASYDEPYYPEGELDQTFKIPLPKDVTITAITPLLVPHGTIVVVGFSNGYVQIFKEQTDKESKERWALEQTIQANKRDVTTIADLKDQKFATGATSGDLKIWTLKQNSKEYSCDATMETGIYIEQIATLSSGNIVVGGTIEGRSGQWQIWDPVTLKKLYSDVIRRGSKDFPFINLLVLPDDRIITNVDYQNLLIYRQTQNGENSERWNPDAGFEAPSEMFYNRRSCFLLPNLNIVIWCMDQCSQIYILDRDAKYLRSSLIPQRSDRSGIENMYAIAILNDGMVAVASDRNLTIFDITNNQHGLNFLSDNNIKISLPENISENIIEHLATLPDGRLLGAFADGAISIWR